MNKNNQISYMHQGTRISQIDDKNIKVVSKLEPGVYIVKYNKMMEEYYFERSYNFSLPDTMYGNIIERGQRILNTFNDRQKSTGVALIGEKGSGKTLLAKYLAIEIIKQKNPVIIIENPFKGTTFNTFISNISQHCMVLFDEFEKVYDRDDQDELLTLLDGVYNNKKLFVFTTNNTSHVTQYLFNRPGRIYYKYVYTGVSDDVIKEYCQKNLKNKSEDNINALIQINIMYSRVFNFDILQSMVEEQNRYNEPFKQIVSHLNIVTDKSATIYYKVEMFENGKKLKLTDESEVIDNPLSRDSIYIYYHENDSEECFRYEILPDEDTTIELSKDGSTITITSLVPGENIKFVFTEYFKNHNFRF